MDDELGSSGCTRSRKMLHKKLVKHKARLLAKGYVQEQDMDFEEVFCPIARMELVITGADDKEIGKFNLQIKNLFKMSDVGLLRY
jgi:hypothetical protein